MTGELGTILRLNQVGRRYLIEEDAGSIAKAVEVMVAVRNDLGCLFYHLLENPLLCDLEHRYMVTGTILPLEPSTATSDSVRPSDEVMPFLRM
jgi:hypothetical protein